MKRLFPILLLLALAFPALAQSPTNRISLTIVVTNRAVTSDTLTVNASTRTWTNTSSAIYIPTNLVSTATTATNLYNNIAAFPYSGGIFPRWLSETSMVLTAPLGGALAASQSGAWAILTLSTQSGPQTFTALWPIENIVTPSNRTNQASSLVGGLSQFSTNAFATNSTATSNFITKGAAPDQHITSPLRVTGTLRATSQLLATNGFTSGMTNINSVSSNHINYGNALRSEGVGANSLQLGSNAVAGGLRSIAVGVNALATNTDSAAFGTGATASTNLATAIGNDSIAMGYGSLAVGQGAVASNQFATALGQASFAGRNGTAVGQGAKATNEQSLAVGIGAVADGTNSIAIGVEATATAYQSAAIGDASSSAFARGVAIGAGATTTTTNQVMLGTATETVTSPGLFLGNTHSNTIAKGTNVINGRVDLTSRANTSLANGNNAGVVLGTNVYVRFPSGPTASYTINGIAAEQDGSWHICEFNNPVNSLIIADNSGTDPVAANRIRTGTGADVTFTNNPVVLQFIYNGTDARWKIANWFR